LLVDYEHPEVDLAAFLAVAMVRVPVGASDSETQIARYLGDRVHAALTVLTAASLSNHALGRCLALCARQADARDDFRLFVVLKDITPADVEAAPVDDIAKLKDIVQFVAADALDSMRVDFTTYIAQLRQIVADARVRWVKVQIAFLAGRFAAIAQLTGVVTAAGLWMALQRLQPQEVVGWLGAWMPLAAVVAQLPFFGAIWLPVYGMMQPRTARTKDYVRSAFAMFIVWCSLTVADSLEVTQSWAMVGQPLGLIFDFVRRRGRYAEWRKLTLRAIDYTKEGVLDSTLQTSVDDFIVDPLTCPLLPEMVPRVFISYTTKSEWSTERAHLVARALSEAGTIVFLDRMFIDMGMNWHRELRRRISDANVFVSFSDSVTMTREYTARELETALRGRALTGTPYSLVLRKKGTVVSAESLPAFRTALDSRVHLPGRVEVIDWNEKSGAESLTWMLRVGHFSGAAVLPTWLSRPLHFAGEMLIAIAGSLGWMVGIVLLVMLLARQPLSQVISPGVLGVMSAWLGFTFRMTLAWVWEIRPTRPSAAWVHAIASAGFLVAAASLWPATSNAAHAGMGVWALAGWLLATWGVEIRRLTASYTGALRWSPDRRPAA
jgi:hypothetical protein